MGNSYRKYSYNNKGFANFDTAAVLDTDDPLTKRAVLFYEAPKGKVHKDSKGRPHYVDADYLETLVENTNGAIQNGTSIYLIQDHKKDDFNSVMGYLDSELYLKQIDKEDVGANPKLKSLLGKLAIFADRVKITGQSLAKKIKEGINFPNISVGLDMENMLIKEISTTVIPALANASLFMDHGNGNGSSALTMDEALYEQSGREEHREHLHELLDVFLSVVDNIRYLRDEDMKGGTRETYYQQAMNDLMTKIADITDIGPDPGYASQSAVQDEINRSHTYAQEGGRPQVTGYSDEIELTEFTMDEMEDAMADFEYERRRRRMGTGTKVALGAGAVGAGVLGTRAGIRGYKAYKTARGRGKGVMGALGSAGKAGAYGVKKDVMGAGKYGWKKAKQYGGAGWGGLKKLGKRIISV